VTTKLP